MKNRDGPSTSRAPHRAAALLVSTAATVAEGAQSVRLDRPIRATNRRLMRFSSGKRLLMPNKRANVKNEKQYEALKDKGMSKERAAKIANSPGASSRGGKKSGSGGNSSQGGTTAQKKAAGRKGGKATARKKS
jgi:hypothetical protein